MVAVAVPLRTLSPAEFGLYALVVFCWSTSWIALRMQASADVAPEVSCLWRFVICAPIMFVWARLAGVPLALSPAAHLRSALMGVCMFSTNFVLFYYGGKVISSGLLAVMFSFASVINLLLAAALLGSRISPRVALGGVMGLAGIALMFWPEFARTQADAALLHGVLLCLVGTLCFCLGNIVSARNHAEGVPMLAAIAWGMVYGALWLLLLSLLRGAPLTVDWSLPYLGSLVYLSVVSTALAFAAYLTLLGRIGPARAGYATVLFPVVALALSTFGETLVPGQTGNFQWTLLAFAGVAVVLAGNLVVLRR
jgi:drug/metabolite transporter (DMT)-like permease